MLHLEILLVTQTRWGRLWFATDPTCAAWENVNTTEWLCGLNRTVNWGLIWFICPLNVPSLFNVHAFFYLLPKPYIYTHIHTHTQTDATTPEALWGSNDTVICYKNLTSFKVTWLHLPRSLRCCGVARRVLPLKRSPSSPTAMIASILSWDEIKVLRARDINLL